MSESNQHYSGDGQQRACCPVSQCYLTVDIVLRSSDKELIGAHKTNLAQFSEGFPAPEDVLHPDEPVDLAENAKTLKLLMQFMHSHRFPDLLDVTWLQIDDILQLADAAEKYMVHSAMAICSLRLADKEIHQFNGIKTLAYGVKYNYPTVADRAAPYTLSVSLDEVTKHLTDAGDVLAWVQYREKYLTVLETVFSGNTLGLKDFACITRWLSFQNTVLRNLPVTLNNRLALLDGGKNNPLVRATTEHMEMLEDCQTGCCPERVTEWIDICSTSLRAIPDFHTLL